MKDRQERNRQTDRNRGRDRQTDRQSKMEMEEKIGKTYTAENVAEKNIESD